MRTIEPLLESAPLDAEPVSDNGKRFFRARLSRACARLRLIYRRHPRLLHLFCFLVPALLMFLVHAVYGVYPFGDNSILVLDMNAQYVMFFEALRRALYGDASLLYSFSRNLGGEFPGIYAYYLSSPLSLIVALFPKRNVLEAIYTLYVVKCGLCGLTFSIFLKKVFRTRDLSTLLFSCCYALSGYAMIMQHNTMWTDCEILLPVICIGVWSLVREKKYKLYTLSLAAAVFSNYYVGYMTCIFLFLYFFYCYFSQTKEERNPNGERAHFLRTLLRMAFFSAIALLLACIVVLPAYYSLQFGKNEFSNPTFEFTSKFKLFDLFGMLLFNAYDTVRPEGMPVLYCGILTLLLIPGFFISRRFRVRERLAGALLCLVLLASFSIKFFDLVWHGLQAPNWLNYRYSFMLIFLLVTFAARAFDGISDRSPRTVALTGLTVILCVFLLQAFGIRYLHDFSGVYPDIAFVSLYAVLILLIVRPRRFSAAVFRSILSVLVLVELFVSALLNLVSLDFDVVISTRPSYLNFLDKWQPVVDEVKAEDPDLFYRIEFLNRVRINESYALGTYGVSGSTSTLNADTISFLDKTGISARSHWAQYCSTNPLTDSLLSIRYIMRNSDADGNMPAVYEKIYDDGTASCYKNPDALPLAFAVDPAIRGITFNKPDESEKDDRTYYDDVSPFAVLETVLRAMYGREESVGAYSPVAVSAPTLKNLSLSPAAGHARYDKRIDEEPASLTFEITGDGVREVFAFFPTRWQRACVYRINGEYGGRTFTGNNGFIDLGVLPAGEKTLFTIEPDNEENEIYLNNTVASYFYYLNADKYRETLSDLSAGGLRLTSFREDRFSGAVSVPEGRTTLFTTIPFDRGWNVRVDGEPVEVYETLDALLAFDVTPGEHEIEFRYLPALYVTAAKLTVVGACAFLAALGCEVVRRVIRKNKEKKACITTSKEN